MLLLGACSSEEKSKNVKILPKENYSDIEQRKMAFFEKLYPIVEKENERIMEEREFVLDAQKKVENGSSLGSSDEQKLKELARKYRVRPEKALSAEGISELERKVGKIPPRLALIQAANESNWGRSRFAREGNNLFGQWCFSKGCGIVPAKRSAGAIHEVASFSSIDMSVRSYMKNLNSHPAYKPLRDIRAENRKSGKGLSAHDMAGGLKSYAGIGNEYIRILRDMMKANAEILDQAEARS
jgi:Bax protein